MPIESIDEVIISLDMKPTHAAINGSRLCWRKMENQGSRDQNHCFRNPKVIGRQPEFTYFQLNIHIQSKSAKSNR